MKKTTVFAPLRISLRMRKGVFKEEVSESQKEGIEGEKQRFMFRISHWWLILLLHECCFTQSMTDWLRPACTHLLPLFLTLYTFFLRYTHFFLKYSLPHSQWDPKRGKHCSLFHLKIFLTRSYSWMIVCVLVAQSCLTLCDLMDCSSAGSSVHGILQ